MDYTLSETHEKMNQFCDKMGSDYFPLPVTLNYFHTSAYDFIGDRLEHVEKTQKITDDIRPLIKKVNLPIIEVPNFDTFPVSGKPPRYAAAIPSNYLRNLAISVRFEDGYLCRRADLKRQAEYQISKNNPFREPTKQYPVILQESSQFFVDSGSSIPKQLEITYCQKPNFATTGEPNTRIVNLPDDAVENILLKTVTRMFVTTGDQRTQPNKQLLEDSFRKIFQ